MTSTTAMPRHRPGLALGVLAGALALDLSGLAVLNAALPSVGARFGLDDATLQWVMTAYSVTFAGFLLVGGRLADVFGRRWAFEAGVALFTAAALTGALAPNAVVLLGARAVQGVGAALSGPAALALLTEVFPAGPARNRALGVYAAVGAAGFSGGVVLGGVLAQFLGWRAVLWFSVALGLAVLTATRAGLPRGAGRRGPLDLPGAVSGTLGLVLLVVGVSWHGARAWTMLGAAAAFLLLFVVREHRTVQPPLPVVAPARRVRGMSADGAPAVTRTDRPTRTTAPKRKQRWPGTRWPRPHGGYVVTTRTRTAGASCGSSAAAPTESPMS